ncbi:molecular chaperone DnaJ [Amaricoccus sp.]|uniref:molecular chaperone DnaJ n=1 Tax=Amaricoccus sp. TaxID=1872485 RepID=UPI00262B5360|nr:molecular chaperone DnaJ [Amaricoccus sp.]HRO11581.1 molecular chaperone DnaJ [Amaricoccus sp.]
MSPLVWGVLILAGAGALWGVARILVSLPPRRALAVVVLAAAAGLAAVRLVPLALAVAALGLGLWRSAARVPSPGQQSEVETAALRMTLDHDSGQMDGEVTAGAFRGARLSELSPEELDRLMAELEAGGDDDSRALLLAWLERQGHGRAAGSGAPPPPDSATMTVAEAYRVLGLAEGASLEEVRAAHSRLIRRVHPDLGGSSALAAMINAAKEVLDPR